MCFCTASQSAKIHQAFRSILGIDEEDQGTKRPCELLSQDSLRVWECSSCDSLLADYLSARHKAKVKPLQNR